jgi:hypothetical protein
VSYTDAVTGNCPKTVRRTWTARDDSGATATCVQTITCRGETAPLTISCPPDRLLACSDCNTDPSNTGVATATGTKSVTLKANKTVHIEFLTP